MIALKLSSAASFCRQPGKWSRAPAIRCSAGAPTRKLAPLAQCNAIQDPPPHQLPPNNSNPNQIKYPINRSNREPVYRAPPPLGFGSRGPERFAFSPSFPLSLPPRSSSFASSPSSGPDPLPRGSGGVVADDDNDMDKPHADVAWCGGADKSPASFPPRRRHPSHSNFLTLPTFLTLGRVAAVPLLVATFYVDSWWGRNATTSIFVAAAVTDWLDGYLARKMKLGTAFGAFLDPVADKLMVAATLVLLCTRPFEVSMFGDVPWLLTIPSIAIIGREITMSAVREWAASQDGKLSEAVAVNNLGKWKTATQMIALTILLATRDSSLGVPGALVALGVVLLYISAGLSVWSLAVYMSKIWRVLLK